MGGVRGGTEKMPGDFGDGDQLKPGGTSESAGVLLSRQQRGSPAPSHSPGPSCPVPGSGAYLNPSAVSLPGAGLGNSAHTQTPHPLLGSVCTGSSGFNPVKPSNFPWEHLLFSVPPGWAGRSQPGRLLAPGGCEGLLPPLPPRPTIRGATQASPDCM